MAIKPTIFKIALQISNMDRHYYGDHAVTIARHASETDERMMMRVLAFCCHAQEQLQFAGGLCEADEPDLWLKDLTGTITLWVDVGLPEEKRLLKACGRAQQVVVYAYGGHSAQIWWENLSARTKRLKQLQIFSVAQSSSQALARLTARTMSLHCSIQDGSLWISNTADSISVDYSRLQVSD